jgi:hypothetical protein
MGTTAALHNASDITPQNELRGRPISGSSIDEVLIQERSASRMLDSRKDLDIHRTFCSRIREGQAIMPGPPSKADFVLYSLSIRRIASAVLASILKVHCWRSSSYPET